jgi:hypothetical protein
MCHPNIALIDINPGEASVDNSSPVSWLHVVTPIEVKPVDIEGPISVQEHRVTPQSALNAQGHLSCKPFQLFSLVPLFQGNTFSISYWDRFGVVVSKIYSLKTDRVAFVALIRRLSREMSPYDLGMDLSVKFAEGFSVFDERFPSYDVFVFGALKKGEPDSEGLTDGYWRTTGPPLYLDTSLIGRGTSTWDVTDKNGVPHILKNTWRHDSERESESDIYRTMSVQPRRGVARFAIGGDVRYLDNNHDISAGSARIRFGGQTFVDSTHESAETVLHRLVLKSIGDPIWSYYDGLQFVRAMKDAILGIRFCH